MPAPTVIRTLTPETKKVLNPPPGAPVIATKADLRDGARPETPGTPMFNLSSTADSITASIVNGEGATSYEIRVDFGAAISGLTVTGLVTDQMYQVQVRGINSAGTGDWSTAVNQAAAAFTGPDPIDGYPTTWDVAPDWDAILEVFGSGTADPAMGANPRAALDNRLTYLGAFRIPYLQGGTNTRVGSRGMQAMTLKAADGTNGPNGSLFLGQGADGSAWAAEVQIPDLSMDTNHLNLPATTVLQTWTELFARAPSGNLNGNSPVGWIRFEGGKLYLTGYNGYDNDGNTENLLIVDTPGDLTNSSVQGFLNFGANETAARYVFDIPLAHQSDFGGTMMAGVCTDLNIVSRSSFGHSMLGWDPSAIQPTDTDVTHTVWTTYTATNPIPVGYSTTNGAVATHYGDILFPPGAFDLTLFYASDSAQVFNWGTDGIAAYTGLPIGAEGGRTRNTFAGLPLPASTLRRHVITHDTGCGCGFFLPGTDTVVFIGSQSGSRFGKNYKNYRIENGPAGAGSGGYGILSDTDRDNVVWMFNVNDIKSRVNPYDPDIYYYTIKNDLGFFNTGSNAIASGFFDPATSRLWLMSNGHAEGKYTSQSVVSVFQVGSGV